MCSAALHGRDATHDDAKSELNGRYLLAHGIFPASKALFLFLDVFGGAGLLGGIELGGVLLDALLESLEIGCLVDEHVGHKFSEQGQGCAICDHA